MSDETVPDYSNEVAEPSVDVLSRLRTLAMKMLLLEDDIEAAEKQAKDSKEKLAALAQKIVPELMLSAGLDEIKIAGGHKIVVEKKIHASLPQDEERKAIWMKYLEETGDAELIKRQVIVDYGKESTKQVQILLEHLREIDVHTFAKITEKADIHNQTLLAYLRREKSAGNEVPLEAFGAFELTIAKIKR